MTIVVKLELTNGYTRTFDNVNSIVFKKDFVEINYDIPDGEGDWLTCDIPSFGIDYDSIKSINCMHKS